MSDDNRYVLNVIIIVAVGIAILVAIAGLFFPRPEPDDIAYSYLPVVVTMNTSGMIESGYIGIDSETYDWRDQFINFSHDDIQISGQVGDDYIEIFIRDTDTGVMARIAGDNVSDLTLEVK